MLRAIVALLAGMVAAGPLPAAETLPAATRPSQISSPETLPAAPVVRRMVAPEARQGVASDGAFVYAVDNSAITRYRIADGAEVARWHGDPALFPHINSCTLADRELVCAASNYPAVPQTSAIEVFDRKTLRHKRSVSLGMTPGSLTVIDRHDGDWWAVFANYDGKGGEPGRDHRYTLFARLDRDMRVTRSWTFPESVLARLRPRSVSGASWGPGGRLYVSGHDLPEIYVLALPEGGSALIHEATIPVASHGQAIDFDSKDPGLLWSIDRASRTVIASRLPRREPNP